MLLHPVSPGSISQLWGPSQCLCHLPGTHKAGHSPQPHICGHLMSLGLRPVLTSSVTPAVPPCRRATPIPAWASRADSLRSSKTFARILCSRAWSSACKSSRWRMKAAAPSCWDCDRNLLIHAGNCASTWNGADRAQPWIRDPCLPFCQTGWGPGTHISPHCLQLLQYPLHVLPHHLLV